MRRVIAVIVMVIILALLFTSCIGKHGVVPDIEKLTSFETHALGYYHDEEHGVGIWFWADSGIFILPDQYYNAPK